MQAYDVVLKFGVILEYETTKEKYCTAMCLC